MKRSKVSAVCPAFHSISPTNESANQKKGNSSRNSAWTAAEDNLLVVMLDDSNGRKKWSALARFLPGRKPMQCRERHAYLCPDYHQPQGLKKPMRDIDALAEKYASIVRIRASKVGSRLTAIDYVTQAQTAIQHEINEKLPYNIGGCCGRSASYFQMLLITLAVQQKNSGFKRLTRSDMLDILEASAEIVKYAEELDEHSGF
jgi:hypothetical protein